MQNLDGRAAHEIIGGHSFLTSELEQPSGIYESDAPDAKQLTNREAAGLLLKTLQDDGEEGVIETQKSARVVPIPHKPKWHGKRVSQFMSNMSPGYRESVDGTNVYGEFIPLLPSDEEQEEEQVS